MRLLNLGGGKVLPWNEKRREFVAKYFDKRCFPEDRQALQFWPWAAIDWAEICPFTLKVKSG